MLIWWKKKKKRKNNEDNLEERWMPIEICCIFFFKIILIIFSGKNNLNLNVFFIKRNLKKKIQNRLKKKNRLFKKLTSKKCRNLILELKIDAHFNFPLKYQTFKYSTSFLFVCENSTT